MSRGGPRGGFSTFHPIVNHGWHLGGSRAQRALSGDGIGIALGSAMMRRLTAATILSLASFLALGCAASSEPEIEPASDGVLEEGAAKADGRSYFEQFRYTIDEAAGTYDSGEPRGTFMASNWTDRVYLETADGRVWTEVDLWMLSDGTAYVEYAEFERHSSSESWEVNARIIRTTWSEADDVLTLPGVGTGVAGNDGGHPSIDITFSTDLVTPGLSGETLSIIRVHTSGRIQHVERDYAEQQG